jgi:hypothetical protein
VPWQLVSVVSVIKGLAAAGAPPVPLLGF